MVPSDLEQATKKLQFVQKGFYSNETLQAVGTYKTQKRDDFLNPNDPRAANNPSLFVN